MAQVADFPQNLFGASAHCVMFPGSPRPEEHNPFVSRIARAPGHGQQELPPPPRLQSSPVYAVLPPAFAGQCAQSAITSPGPAPARANAVVPAPIAPGMPCQMLAPGTPQNAGQYGVPQVVQPRRRLTEAHILSPSTEPQHIVPPRAVGRLQSSPSMRVNLEPRRTHVSVHAQLVQAPEEPEEPDDDANYADLSLGEVVEVYRHSRQEWTQSTVVDVAGRGAHEVPGIPRGSVRIAFPGGVRWVLQHDVALCIRRFHGQAVSRLCKRGCGRACQPGLTRSMQPYDTCCKKCASDPSSGEHDENCGGRATLTRKRIIAPDDFLESFQSHLRDDDTALACFRQVAGVDTRISAANASAALHALLRDVLKSETLPRSLVMAAFEASDKDGDGLVCRNEFLHLCKEVCSLCFPRILTVQGSSFVKRNLRRVEEVYKFGEKLGEGSFGVVFKAKHRISGHWRVCKKIKKNNSVSEEDMLREIYSMAVLDHPNVLKVYEFFNDDECLSQILEPCKGGELQDRIDAVFKKGKAPYDERFICDVMKQTLRALAFMHSHKPPIVHKDLKPQNIMMEDRESSSIKVIDFGLAELFQPGKEYCNVFGGTLLYMAPEVFAQQISVKVDVWSAGVILYNLITGDFPYSAPWPPPPGCNQGWWEKETARKICNEPMQPHPRLGSVRRECQDLLRSMLNRKVEQRPDASQCLDHPWFKIWDEEPPPLSVGVSQCLEAFSRQSELKKAIFLLMARECEVPALLELRALFTHFDVKNQGRLEARDLREVFSRCNLGPVSSERVLHALDRNGGGSVCWTEFLAAALCVSLPRNPAHVDGTFAFFDDDHDGKISSGDFLRVLAHGEHTEEWKKTMPALFSEVLGKRECVPGASGVLSVPMSVLKAVVKPVLGEDKISKAKFRAYVTAFMEFSPGQELHAGG
uniref:non-specific serine/threonine protein kinase n=1 Tax=Noctiluca scintillans TaxID=2966 RepID=A0A7S1EUP7_NOCSC